MIDRPIDRFRLHKGPKWAEWLVQKRMKLMKSMSAKEAKDGFGRLIDTARASPLIIEKHGRPVVVVLSVEEYERLKAIESKRAAV